MKKIGIIGSGQIGLATAAAMTQLKRAHLEPIYLDSSEQVEYIQAIIEMASPDFLNSGRTVFVVGNEDEAAKVRYRILELGMDFNVQIANNLDRFGYPMHSFNASDWTPPMIRAKSEYWDAQQPRHCSLFTKSQPSAKARKAARRRAKKGRKTNR